LAILLGGFCLPSSLLKYATLLKRLKQKSGNFESILKNRKTLQKKTKKKREGSRQGKHAKLLKTCLCPLALGAYNEILLLPLAGMLPLDVSLSINLGEILTSESES